jgi:hypothetical protein
VSAREWRDLLRALRAVGHAALLVRTRPRGQLVTPVDASASRLVSPEDRRRAATLAWAVDRVADLPLVRATCLVRALALQRMLVADGIHHGRVCVGVTRGSGRLEAHAWVELGAHALGSAGRERARYTRMSVIAGRHA